MGDPLQQPLISRNRTLPFRMNQVRTSRRAENLLDMSNNSLASSDHVSTHRLVAGCCESNRSNALCYLGLQFG